MGDPECAELTCLYWGFVPGGDVLERYEEKDIESEGVKPFRAGVRGIAE